MDTNGQLLKLMCLGHLQDVAVTSDGFFLGMEMGDIGYNVFLGQPNPGTHGREFSRSRWQELTFSERKAVVRRARGKAINLRLFLPKGVVAR